MGGCNPQPLPQWLRHCFEDSLFERSVVWRFWFITMIIISSSDGRVSRAIALKVVDLGLIPSSVKPKIRKLVFATSVLDTQH